MYKGLIVALALIASAPGAFAQHRLEAVVFLSNGAPLYEHPADPSLMRVADLNAGEALKLPATDYPQAARRAGHRGEVALAVRIGVDDRILDCRVTDPAPSADLTAAACPLVQRRAVFRHALATDGSARETVLPVKVDFDLFSPNGSVSTVIAMPEIAGPNGPGDLSVSPTPDDPRTMVMHAPATLFPTGAPFVHLNLDAGGHVTRCSIYISSGSDQGDLLACRTAGAALFRPKRDARGTAMPSDTIERMEFAP